MLEGTDSKVHFIYYTAKMEEARGNAKLRTNSFVRLRSSIADGRPTLDIHDYGDADRVLSNRSFLGETVRAFLKRGVIPSQDGWGGWLGEYQTALASIASQFQDRELGAATSADRRRDRSRGR